MYGSQVEFPCKDIWTWGIPSNVSFFPWTSFLNKILTLSHLKSKTWNLANRCYLCRKEEELVDHLFIHCYMVQKILDFLFALVFLGVFPPYIFRDFIELVDISNFIWRFLPWALGFGSKGIFVSLRISTPHMSTSVFGCMRLTLNGLLSKDFDLMEWFDF